MKPALLDVNVLIALIDPSHEFGPMQLMGGLKRIVNSAGRRARVRECLCAVLAQPGYPYLGLGVREIRGILAEFCSDVDHRFWAGSLSVLDGARFDLSEVGPKQLSRVY